MAVDPKLIEETDDAFRRFDRFIGSLNPSDETTGRFYHMISALSSAAKVHYTNLRRAYDLDDQTIIAWSCRNLLELAIFTKFVLISKSNFEEFAADRLIDGSQIGTSLKKLDLHLNPNLVSSAFDGVIADFERQKAAEGIVRSQYLATSYLASQLGMKEEYEAVNKLCSKFVHPTAWSLLTADIGSERFPEAREIFYTTGAMYFAMIYAEIAPHIRQWGLRHKP